MKLKVRIGLMMWMLAVSAVGMAQESINFRVEVSRVDQALAYSNITEVDRPFTLFVPNAFTPNGDGLNDVFRVSSEHYSYYRIVVYDRWGNQVFESMNAEVGWDGTSQGNKMPLGVYTYQIVMRNLDGVEWNKTGHVTIAKND